jgi:hypothetical protein
MGKIDQGVDVSKDRLDRLDGHNDDIADDRPPPASPSS